MQLCVICKSFYGCSASMLIIVVWGHRTAWIVVFVNLLGLAHFVSPIASYQCPTLHPQSPYFLLHEPPTSSINHHSPPDISGLSESCKPLKQSFPAHLRHHLFCSRNDFEFQPTSSIFTFSLAHKHRNLWSQYHSFSCCPSTSSLCTSSCSSASHTSSSGPSSRQSCPTCTTDRHPICNRN